MAERPQDIGILPSQCIIQVDRITWKSSLEFYHLTVLCFILFLTFSKLLMLHHGILFVRIDSWFVNTLDNLEMFTNSQRVLALYSVSFLAFSSYVGKSSMDKQQYFFQKITPFFIALIHSAIMVLKRKFLFTYDDLFCLLIFLISFALYYTYESPSAYSNNRIADPFLHQDPSRKKNSPLLQQVLTEEERLRQVIKNMTPQQLFNGINQYNENLANSIAMNKDEIKRRKAYLDEELRKFRQSQDDFIQKRKNGQ